MEVILHSARTARAEYQGQDVALELVAYSIQYATQDGSNHRIISQVALAIIGPSGNPLLTRAFATPEERVGFLNQYLCKIRDSSDAIRVLTQTWIDPMSSLVGRIIDSVEFVEDYLQIRSGTCTLTLYVLPTIGTQGTRIEPSASEYSELMSSLRGQTLTDADELLDRGIVLKFSTGMWVALGPDELRRESVAGGDIAHINTDTSWYLWDAATVPWNA